MIAGLHVNLVRVALIRYPSWLYLSLLDLKYGSVSASWNSCQSCTGRDDTGIPRGSTSHLLHLKYIWIVCNGVSKPSDLPEIYCDKRRLLPATSDDGYRLPSDF